MHIAILGPTGSGKGTQAARLVYPFELRLISPGQLLRENSDRQTALGILGRRYVERGELVPDEVVDAMIEEAVRKTVPLQGLLFDGFPRTEYQASFLEDLLDHCNRTLDVVIYLHATEETVFERAARRVPPRADDSPEILRHRLRVFHRAVAPVLKRFAEAGRLLIVNAEPAADVVHDQLARLLTRIKNGERPRLTAEDVALLEGVLPTPIPAPAVAYCTHHGSTGRNLLLLGGPGTGKGTQAIRLAGSLGVPHISSGDLFREHVQRETELGKIAKVYMDAGDLVPDDLTDAMIGERLAQEDTRDGFVLDGFPRTLPQAHALAEMLTATGRTLDRALLLEVPEEELIRRLTGRRLCPICQAPYHLEFNPPKLEGICDRDGGHLYQREDDTLEIIQARLRNFQRQTAPVIDYYRQRGLVTEIVAAASIESTAAAIAHAVD